MLIATFCTKHLKLQKRKLRLDNVINCCYHLLMAQFIIETRIFSSSVDQRKLTKMSLEKFRILLWKNWTVQKRHYKSGVFEVLFPVILIVIFSFIMFELGKDDDPSSLYIYENSFDNWSSCPVNIRRTEKVFYSPSSPWIDGFLNSEFNGEDEITIEAFENSQSLEDFLNNSPPQGVFGIEFDDSLLVSRSFSILFLFNIQEIIFS